MTRTILALALPAVLIACDGTAPPEQLELAAAVLVTPDQEFQTVSLSGPLSVSGVEGDFQLVVGEETEAVSFSVHSAARSDLTLLDGLTVDASLPVFGFADERSLLVSDAAGPVYVLDAGYSMSEVNALFGRDVVSVGEALVSGQDATWKVDYVAITFASDDGPVSLLPGEVTGIALDGVSWRAAVVSGLDREARPNAAMPGCPVLEDILSYELLRLESPADEESLVRPAGAVVGSLGCM